MDKTTPMKGKPLVDVTCKLGVKGCYEDGRCHALGSCENKIVTNADRIRAMSDEELSVFLWSFDVVDIAMEEDGTALLRPKLTKWLKQPAEE